ncbi:C2 domain [Pseudocohnilembus persalinus]|uniref:C2 domain n=1 Tax=Pseudocohnilembus persalinus TaxID=266149 RepID=A0A0V0QT99_PSEPJ|nr:C2 domain [Pseudocohnilembus persalinus]|eukprot:KRX05194.1 C2 domain [Pseudocohnilembus persalinus]
MYSQQNLENNRNHLQNQFNQSQNILQQQTQLLVSLHNVEFAKEFNYFITVQLESEGEKRRTDISACVSNPVFTASVFVIPFNGFQFQKSEKLHFAAFVVTDREAGKDVPKDLESQGQAKLLGECTLDVSEFKEVLEDMHSTGVRRQLKFSRITGDREVGVGRFIANLKLLQEQIIPVEEHDFKPLEKDEIFHELPKPDPFYDFQWRVRVDIRSATDIPLNRISPSGLPSTYCNIGYTLYDGNQPDNYHLDSTSLIESNRHPIWNKQFLITNPETSADKTGFIYIGIYDKCLDFEPIDTIYIPIQPLQPFVPMNFEFLSTKGEYEARPRYLISVVLEEPNKTSLIDSLCDIVIHNANFDPLPYASRMFICMTLNNHQTEIVPFTQCQLGEGQNISNVIQQNSSDRKAIFISTMHKIPPYISDNLYNSIAIFSVPKSYLDKSIQFFIAAKDDSIPSSHVMPNGIVGHTDITDDLLKKLFFQKEKKSAHIPVTWDKQSKMYPVFQTTKCLLEINCFNQDSIKEQQQDRINQSQLSDNSRRTASDKLADFLGVKFDKNIKGENQKVNVLVRELSQKQEIIHRMIKELDDKGESLKITASEIVDLRRQIKLLQSENAILRKKLAVEEQLEVQTLIQKEISMMSAEELRNKILKLAQAYRDERVRNEEFDKALKNAQREIAQSRQLQHELDLTQRRHAENAKKLLIYQQEIQKIAVYKETIRKQERVIQKLEKLMETTLKDTQKARSAQLELEQLRTENYQLQSKIKLGFGGEGEEIEKLRMEIVRLEKIISELREQLKSKRPVSQQGGPSGMMEGDMMELEIKLQKSMARNDALSEELILNAKNYSREIAQLKLVIAEKQAMLDTLTVGY